MVKKEIFLSTTERKKGIGRFQKSSPFMKKIYNFIFQIGSKVKIKELNLNGKVSAIYIDSSLEVTYRVRYFYESKPNEVYFDANELELIENGEQEKNMIFNRGN